MPDHEQQFHPQELERQGLSNEEMKQIVINARAYEDAQPPEVTPWAEIPYDPKTDMLIGLHNIPVEVGKRFDGHGIDKGMTVDQIGALNKLLTTGIDPEKPFYSMPLKGAEEYVAAFGAGGPYPGSFVILGEVDKRLTDGIKYVLTNSPFVPSIPLLSEKFPQVEFIPVSTSAGRLQEIVEK